MKVIQSLLVFLLLIPNLYAEMRIEVTKGIDQPTLLAVVPFAWQEDYALVEDVADIVAQDFNRSGIFYAMEPEHMLSNPSYADEVSFRDWRSLKQEYVVIGRIKKAQEGRITAEYELYDVLKEERLLSKSYQIDLNNIRDLAHMIADDVYQQLTGIKGAFYTRIMYVALKNQSQGKSVYELRVSDSDGARSKTIFSSVEPIMSPAWSADAKRVAYVSFETNKPAIYMQDLDTGKRQKLQSFKGLNGAPAWSPKGDKMALVLSKDGNPEIYVLNLKNNRVSRITYHYGIDTEPSWSEDGQSLIFTSDRGGSPQIYQVHLATGLVDRLTYDGTYNSRASLTQNGRFLAMVHQQNEIFHIAVKDLKSGRLDILTETFLDESPSIAPNGSMILYATQQGDRGVLAGVTLDASVRFLFPDSTGHVRDPAWSPYLR